MKYNYELGRRLRSLNEFEESECDSFFVVLGEHMKRLSRGFLGSWQYNYLKGRIERGCVFEAMERRYCDRNICFRNEFNGIECENCEVTLHNAQLERVEY